MTTRSVGIWHHRADELLAKALMDALSEHCNPLTHEPILVLAGAPDLVGDCIGPRVGDLLQRGGFTGALFGDSDRPVSCTNAKVVELEARDLAWRIGRKPFLVVVDAALGPRIGTVAVHPGPLEIGSGVSWKRRRGHAPYSIGDLAVGCFTARTDPELDRVDPDLVGQMVAVVCNAILAAWEQYQLHTTTEYGLMCEAAEGGGTV